MSQTIISTVVIILSTVLPKLGIEIGSEALTTTITTLVTLAAAGWIWIRRYQAGDVTFSGKRI